MAFPTDLADVVSGGNITASRNNAITNKIGIDSSSVVTSLDYLLKSTSSGDPGHLHTKLGTVTTGTLSTGAVIGGVTMDVAGTDAEGDIYYRNGSGVLTRLAISGTEDHVLSVSSGGLPEWAAAGGGSNDFTGAVTITANIGTAALEIEQSGAGTMLDLKDESGTVASFGSDGAVQFLTPGQPHQYLKYSGRTITFGRENSPTTQEELLLSLGLSGGNPFLNITGGALFVQESAIGGISIGQGTTGYVTGEYFMMKDKHTWLSNTYAAAEGTITWTHQSAKPIGFILGSATTTGIGHMTMKAGASGTTGSVAYVAMESSNSTMYYLFFGDDMDLRVDTTKPVGNDQGTVVGTQS